MATAKAKKQPVMEVVPEVITPEVISEADLLVKVDKVISHSLQEKNITETVLKKIEDDYLPLQLKSLEDKEGYMEIVEARKSCKKLRALTTDVCKKGREWAILEQKKWVAKEKEVTERIGKVEDHLSKMEDEYDAEQDRIRAEKKAKHDRQYTARFQELTSMGAIFNGTDIVLQDVSVEIFLLREMDEEIYQEITLPKFRYHFDIAEKARLEKEAKGKAEREAFEAKQKEIEEREEKLRKWEADQKAEADRKEKKRQDAEKKQREDLIVSRIESLIELGGYKYEVRSKQVVGNGFAIDEAEMLIDADKWKQLFELASDMRKGQLEKDAQAAETARLDKIEKDKQDTIAADNARKAAEKAAADKALADKAEADRQAEVKRLADLAAASDKVKYADLLAQLNGIVIPECTSPTYRKKVGIIRDFIADLN